MGEARLYRIGALTVTAPWTRATPKGAEAAVGYLTVTNTGKEADHLTGGSAKIASRLELHEMTTVEGVMKMRLIPGGLEIKPGETLELKPGGLHIMMPGLTASVKEGDTIKASLIFEKAGPLEIEFLAAGIGAGAPPAQHGQGDSHAH